MGACLRQNGDIDYLDILFDTCLFCINNYANLWSRSAGVCTESEMMTSPTIDFPDNYRTNNLHLSVAISELVK